MKSIPFLSDKAKALVIEAFDRNIVTFYDNVDRFVKLQLRYCDGDLKGKAKEELGQMLFIGKVSNPSYKYIEDIWDWIVRDERLAKWLYDWMCDSGDILPSDFMSYNAGMRWFELSGVKNEKHKQLYKPAVKHFINEGLFLYDIKKGYFAFEIENKKRLVVPIEEYDPNDNRQQNLKSLWIQPLNETNHVAVTRFLYRNKQEITELLYGAVPERLVIKNDQEEKQVIKSSNKKGLTGVEFNRLIDAQIAELEGKKVPTASKKSDIIINIDELEMIVDLFAPKNPKKGDGNKPKPSPKVYRKRSTTAGSVNYTRQIVERNDDD